MLGAIFPYIVIFLLGLNMPADTDLGWHLKYGEYFAKTGHILRDNIFSLEMPGYKWPNISWLTDFISYSIYHRAGFLGLSIAGAITIVLIFFFIDKALKMSFWEKAFIFPLFLHLMNPLINVSFRGQLITALGTSILIYFLMEFQRGRKKFIFWTIPLILVWSNMHGEFLFGLVILSMYLFLRYLKLVFEKKYKEFKRELIYASTILFSFVASLINPYAIEIYKEVIRHFGNPYEKYILEWIPLPPFSGIWWILIFWGIFLIIILRLLISEKKFSEYFEWFIIVSVFYFLSHWMRRYAWTMYLVSAPLAEVYFESIKPSVKSFLYKSIPIAIFAGFYLYAVYFHIPNVKFKSMNWDRFCQEFIHCSPKSAEFLMKNKLPGKFMSFYNWGGWLIWNYPDIKPSIVGRMHLWRDENGYSAFGKYYFLEQNVTDIDKSDYDVIYMSTEKPLHKKMIQLVNAGKWRVVYGDQFAGIFVRVNGNTSANNSTTKAARSE